jgi:hypothetical protein
MYYYIHLLQYVFQSHIVLLPLKKNNFVLFFLDHSSLLLYGLNDINHFLVSIFLVKVNSKKPIIFLNQVICYFENLILGIDSTNNVSTFCHLQKKLIFS